MMSEDLEIVLTLIPATGGGGEMNPPCGFCRKWPSKQWSETAIFCDVVTDPLGFPTQLSTSLYLLPVLRGRFWSNVHVTGFATTSIVRLWSKVINFTGATFLMLETENGNVTIGMSINNGICTFSRWRTKPEVVTGHHLEHIVIVTDSYSRMNLKYKYYCNSSAKNKFSTIAKLKESVLK